MALVQKPPTFTNVPPLENRSYGMTNILFAAKEQGDVEALSALLMGSSVDHFIHPHRRGDSNSPGRSLWLVFFTWEDQPKVYDAIDAMP